MAALTRNNLITRCEYFARLDTHAIYIFRSCAVYTYICIYECVRFFFLSPFCAMKFHEFFFMDCNDLHANYFSPCQRITGKLNF